LARPRSLPREHSVPPDKDVLDVDDVAALMDLNTETVRRLAREGKLPGRKVGGAWRVALLPAGVACLARRRAGRLSPWSRNASEQLPCGCCAPSDLTGRGHIMHEATDVSVSLSTGPRLLPLRMVST